MKFEIENSNFVGAQNLCRFQGFLTSIFIGIVCFLITSNPEIINPSNLSWLRGEDPALHHLGWNFYRFSPWEFPLGNNPKYGLEISTSVIYSDSIPILAIPLKLFNPLLPVNFQFLGVWTLICFIGQSIISWKIIGLRSQNFTIQFICTFFLTFTPILIENVGWDTALLSHFFILCSIYLCIATPYVYKRTNWALILVGSFLVQFYIFAMILPLWIVSLINFHKYEKNCLNKTLFEFLLVLTTLLVCAWFTGYFEANMGAAPAWGFGYYRFNLLSPLAPKGWSYILKDWYKSTSTVESLGYLGAGTIFLIICLIPKTKEIIFLLYRSTILYKYLATALFFLLLFSLSSNIGIGAIELKLPITERVYKLASSLRSSGRFFWPCWYTILIAVLFLIIHFYKKKVAILLLTIAIFIQISDTSSGWIPIRKNKTGMSSSHSIFNESVLPLHNRFWIDAPNHYQNVKLAPLRHEQVQGLNNSSWNWLRFASYADKFRMGTNSVYLVRTDARKIDNANSILYQQISSGNYDPKSLLILDDDLVLPASVTLNRSKDLLARIDGMNVLAPGWKSCHSCEQVDYASEIGINTFLPIINKAFEFSKNSNGTQFLTQVGRSQEIGWGWSYPESWGTWSDGTKSNLIIPTPSNNFNELIINITPFLDSKKHPKQVVEININDQKKMTLNLTQLGPQSIILNLDDIKRDRNFLLIEFVFKNSISPKSIGIGDDDRKLGIGIISAMFK